MKIAKLLLLAGVSALVLVGCSLVAPSREKVEQDVKQSIHEQVPELQEQWLTLAESDTVRAGWIKSFNDPVLKALLVEAQQNNRELAVAAGNVDRALSLAQMAGAALMPNVNVIAMRTESGMIKGPEPSLTTWRLGAGVSWEVDVWGRIKSGQRAAIASAQAVEADLRAARESLAAATARAYFTAIEANLQVALALETINTLTETQRIVNVRYKNGIGLAQDVSLANSDLATARASLTNIKGSYRNALRALEVLLGRYPGAELQVRENLPDVPPPPAAGLPSQLLERRPDIVAAERRVASAFNATNQARAAQLPRIGLTGTIGGASDSLSDLLDPSNIAWRVGANLLAPLYDGGRRRAAVDIATAEQDQALAAYAQIAINAFREVETNLDQGVVIGQRIVDLKDAVTEAERALSKARRRHEEGEESLLGVLVIQRRVTSASSNLSMLNRLLLEQRVNLNLALGGGWEY